MEVAKKIVKAITLSLTNLFSLFPSVRFVQLSIYCCLFLRFVCLIDFFGIDHSLLLLCWFVLTWCILRAFARVRTLQLFSASVLGLFCLIQWSQWMILVDWCLLFSWFFLFLVLFRLRRFDSCLGFVVPSLLN